MRAIALLTLLTAGCNDYNLQGSGDVGGKYNPPDLASKEQVDRITQVTIPAVDVLWVIDNSCSMEEEQRALRDNFSSFMQYFTGSGLDYHVGVVSTDMDNRQESGKLILDSARDSRYIDDTMSEEEAVSSFRDRALLGVNGSGTEAGLDAAMAALTTERYSTNDGFYRDEASLSIVVISDEPDQSDVSVNEFTTWIGGLKTEEEYTVSFSAIVGPDRSSCSTAERGTYYIEVATQLDGIIWPICEEDYSTVLEELGLRAAGLKQEFFLSLVPVEESIVVTVEDSDGVATPYAADTDWTYSRTRNSITFGEFTPLPLNVVDIRYEVLASTQGVVEEEVTETPE
ncbi:MAG: hypothetical protein Q8P41_09255 [Pseudomonadota bacterium]|nr:hypothetical protein [Pseudomonadota bacterium]